ncbi:MAG: Gfo/Idh/MocA family oxidoreductase [Planctomycetes bacterium]|nr:Gfo/Idh/MocA family oxidoreductase [Planctomycetota bacterium]
MTQFSRRQFLGNASLAAAAAAVSSIPVLGSELRRSVGASERLRIATIGVKGRGLDHLNQWLKMADVEVAAICDIDENVIHGAVDRIEKVSGKKPVYYKDLRKLFEDKSIDAVSVATCNHWHSLAGIWAVQAGKHAYVEKPVSHNIFEGRKLVEAGKKYAKVVAVGTQCRSMKGMRDAMDFLHSGKLGKVKVARGFCYKSRKSIGKKPNGPVPSGVDFDIWLGPAPERPFNPNRFHYNWHWMWDTGNGDLGNQGVHQVDIARWGINKNEHPLSTVSVGGRLGYEDDGETPNTQISVQDYGDVQLIFEVRGLPTDKYAAVQDKNAGVLVGDVFECTEGLLVVPSYSGAIAYSPKGELIQRFGGGEDAAHFRNFIDAIKTNKPESLNAPALDGHYSAAACHLANISHRLGTPKPLSTENPFGKNEAANETYRRFRDHLKENNVPLETNFVMGREIKFDSKTETVTGDAEASKLLTREYRKPYVVPENV